MFHILDYLGFCKPTAYLKPPRSRMVLTTHLNPTAYLKFPSSKVVSTTPRPAWILKLPQELLWSILLPGVTYQSVSHVFHDRAPDVANHDPEFFLRWRKFWKLRTVCRRFNDFLFPLLSHAFRQEALSILAATIIVDGPQHELGWMGVIEGCYHPLQPLNQILEHWTLGEKQRTSFLWNMYVALRKPNRVVIRDDRLISATNNDRAEKLVLCAFDDWCWLYREDLLRLGGPTGLCMHWWRGEDPVGCDTYRKMKKAQMQTLGCLHMAVADPSRLVDDFIKLRFSRVGGRR